MVKTLVTTELIRRIADDYGVQTAGDLLVGFKYIGGEMDRRGPAGFRLRGRGVVRLPGRRPRPRQGRGGGRDALVRIGRPAEGRGQTLHEKLDELFLRYGCHSESQLSLQMPGEKGMDDMKALMAGLRSQPPRPSPA